MQDISVSQPAGPLGQSCLGQGLWTALDTYLFSVQQAEMSLLGISMISGWTC